MIQNHLLLGPLHNVLLHTVARHQPVDVDLSLLADAVSSGLCLQVVLWVPVRVEYHDRVCRGQIDPQPPSTGGQKEAEILRAFCVEVVDGIFTQVPLDRAI